MKKISKFLSLCLIGVAGVAAVTSCDDKPSDNNPGSNEVAKYTITYNINGHGVQIDNVSGSTLPDVLPTLSDEKYDFSGWYYDAEFKKEAKPGDAITSDITLYAKWVENKGDTPVNSDEAKYQILAKAMNGKPLSGIAITLSDSTGKIVKEGYTGTNGYANFTLKKGSYIVEAEDDIENGYTLQDEYRENVLTDAKGQNVITELVFDAKIVADSKIPETDDNFTYSQGDLMYDYTFTGYDFSKPIDKTNSYEQVTYKLSDLLESNDLVVLNFWYTTCSWCKREFPMMEEAYAEYKDKGVKIIGINPGEQVGDTIDVVNQFAQSMSLNIMSTVGDTSLVSPFQVSGWPTSVFIDRYGLIGSIESGAITSKAKWVELFKSYTSDKYVPKYDNADGSTIVPDAEFPGSSALVNASVAADFKDSVKFENEERSGYEYNWPWVVADFDDTNGKHRTGIMPSNKGVHSSYSISYFTIKVPANSVLSLDVYCSTDDGDILGIFIGGKRMSQISGLSDEDTITKYIYISGDVEETVTVELFFYKDKSGSLGDDTVVVNNIRCFDVSQLNTPVYMMRQAATNYDSGLKKYDNYITPVLGDDGYYHVGSKTGPLLLAALLDNNTNFSNTAISTYLASNPDYFIDDNGSFYNIISEFAEYATNSKYSLASDELPTSGLTPITEELKNALVRLTYTLGEDADKSTEWLQMCVYVEFYGTNGVDPIGDPIKGLARFNAYEAVELDTTSEESRKATTNSIEYTFALLPKGYYFKFTPTKSGVYKIFSNQAAGEPTEVFFEGGNTQSYAGELRDTFAQMMPGYNTSKGTPVTGENFVDFMYYEAGHTYYIKPAFWDVDYVGTVTWCVEYIAENDYHYYQASESTFSTTIDSDGNMTGTIISRKNINVELGDDKYYHPVRNGQVIVDEFIYADFGYLTGIFSSSNLANMIEYEVEKTNEDGSLTKVIVNAFDFTKDEFGDSYSDEDIIKYNLRDRTEDVKSYCYDAMYKKNADGEFVDKDGNPTTDPEKFELWDDYKTNPDFGLVKVDETLQGILQGLMDKFTFYGITDSWMKLCYYKGYLGPINK